MFLRFVRTSILPYPNVFKPLIILALDEYFKHPSIKVLQDLYKSVNSIDISYIPVLTTSEKYILRFFTNKYVLKNKFDLAMKYISEHISRIKQESMCCCQACRGVLILLGVYRDVYNKLSKEVEVENIHLSSGGGITKETHMPNIKDGRYFETKVTYKSMNVPIRIPLTLFPEEFPEVMQRGSAAVIPLLHHDDSFPYLKFCKHLAPDPPSRAKPALGSQSEQASRKVWDLISGTPISIQVPIPHR